MAHLVETMAYVGQKPWHGLGSALTPKQPLEVWAQQAGMDWRILESPVRYITDGPASDPPGAPAISIPFRDARDSLLGEDNTQ